MNRNRLTDEIGNRLLRPPRTMFGQYTNRGPGDRRHVALTFDDGPSDPSTGYLLDVLDARAVPATFFCVGRMAQQNGHLVARAFEAGHVIANHSLRHGRRDATRLRQAGHIDQSADVIADIIGVTPRLYRPPWGWLSPQEALRVRRRSMAAIGWDVYPDDWIVPEVDAVVLASQVTTRVQPGSIVLMHDGRAIEMKCAKRNTAKAVDIIIEKLREDGYAFVTVPDLLGVDAYGPRSS